MGLGFFTWNRGIDYYILNAISWIAVFEQSRNSLIISSSDKSKIFLTSNLSDLVVALIKSAFLGIFSTTSSCILPVFEILVGDNLELAVFSVFTRCLTCLLNTID